jgi:16S rRNA (cytosine1402-N4)-methyltransferase
MPREVLEVLAPVPGERFLDLTVGAAGHALEIAPRLGPDGLLIGVDLDAAVIDIAGNNLTAAGLANFRLHQGNFADCRAMLSREGLSRVNGVLVDLGVSSFELRDASRGFSFVSDGPLDMRMDASAPGVTAAELVNSAPEWELERIFREYGEERLARRIAREIVRTRRDERIERTNQLAQIARRAYGRFGWQRIHPATRIFQALRIAVNDELENLKTLLEIMPDLLEANGRVAVIAFHSLEDRLVKEDFRNRSRSGVYQLLTKRPLRPSPEEVAANPRSRSARLRAAKRSDI